MLISLAQLPPSQWAVDIGYLLDPSRLTAVAVLLAVIFGYLNKRADREQHQEQQRVGELAAKADAKADAAQTSVGRVADTARLALAQSQPISLEGAQNEANSLLSRIGDAQRASTDV